MSASITCPRCHSVWDAPMRFCANCGYDLAGVEPRDSSSQPDQVGSHRDDRLLARVQSLLQGEFKVEATLGRGGMGSVYLARDTSLDRRVAIKVLSPEFSLSENMVQRFAREARTVAGLDHPNIIAIYRVFERDGLTFLVMKYVEGLGLDVVSSFLPALPGLKERQFPVSVVLCILLDVAIALAYAHQNGVVHRDVKPSNIMINAAGSAVVTDFGIAQRDADVSLTQTGALIGTPTYMSPEQVQGSRVGPQTDQYSLGVLLYELLAGKPPFTGSYFELIHKQAGEAPEPLGKYRDDVPPELDRIVMRMLEKDPARRFESLDQIVRGDRMDHLIGDAAEGMHGSATAWPRRVLSDAVKQAVPRRRRSGVGVGGSDAPVPPITSAPVAPRTKQEPQTLVEAWAPTTKPPPPPQAAVKRTGDLDTQIGGLVGKIDDPSLFKVALTITKAADPVLVGTSVECDKFPFVIGREEGVSLRFPNDVHMSRRHFEIDRDDSGFLIRDFSSNGVFIDGMRAGSPGRLPINAVISLSKDTQLTFVANIPPLPDFAKQVIDGRYRLEQMLYRSMKAATYRADAIRLPMSVTVKIFTPALMSVGLYREEFERTAQIAGKLQHPSICKVIDVGKSQLTADGIRTEYSFLCTEYLAGGNLATRDTAAVEPANIVAWFTTIADALEYCHTQGVIHGGLKPTCVVFDADGKPHLTDFAFGSTSSEGKTRPIVGTPDFLAPEQWEGKPASKESDQYSLAVMAYLALTGRRPHLEQDKPESRERNFRIGPPPAHEEAAAQKRNPLSKQVSTVLAKGLSADPANRYPAVRDFAAALAAAVSGRNTAGGAPNLFLSYRRKSSTMLAWRVTEYLRGDQKWVVFFDAEQQDGAKELPDQIKDAITRCDVFICLLSPTTLKSDWVRQEVEHAFAERKPMLTVLHAGFKPKKNPDAESEALVSLLKISGVRVLDDTNDYVPAAMSKLADRIRKTVGLE